MEVIHYHGTPITPRSVLYELTGKNFCVSYSDKRDVEICHQIGQSVMLDNGAYSFWKRGQATDWNGYMEALPSPPASQEREVFAVRENLSGLIVGPT